MNRDLVEVLVALALIATSAGVAISGAAPKREALPRAKRERSQATSGPLPELSGAAPVLEASVTAASFAGSEVAVSGGGTRPRIFTGEPTEPEPGKPATKRALKLLGGLTALAAAGALGLLALVRAMVSLFDRIG